MRLELLTNLVFMAERKGFSIEEVEVLAEEFVEGLFVRDMQTGEYAQSVLDYAEMHPRFIGDIGAARRETLADVRWAYEMMVDIGVMRDSVNEELCDVVSLYSGEGVANVLASSVEELFIKDSVELREVFGGRFYDWLMMFMDGQVTKSMPVGVNRFRRLRLLALIKQAMEDFGHVEGLELDSMLTGVLLELAVAAANNETGLYDVSLMNGVEKTLIRLKYLMSDLSPRAARILNFIVEETTRLGREEFRKVGASKHA